MAGVKGKSGRKSRYQQVKDGNLLEVCTDWLISNFHTFDKDIKIRVALEIAKKGIVQKLEHSGNITWEQLIDDCNAAEAQYSREVQVISNN